MNNKLNRYSFEIFKKGHRTYIEAHRGVNKEFPQNTIKAFKRAIEYNLDGIELDIWLSQDLIPVILHGGSDGELEDFTDHKGYITELYLEEIKKIKTVPGNEPIPTLEEVFILCKNIIFINIEIKDNRIDKVFPILIQLIEKYEMQNQIQISSFRHEYYDKIKEYNEKHEKKIEFGFLYPVNSIMRFWYFINYNYDNEYCTLNIINSDITEDMIKKAHEGNMRIMAWFKMGEEENYDIYSHLFALGVDSICSNNPLLLKEFRDKVEKGEIIPKLKEKKYFCSIF